MYLVATGAAAVAVIMKSSRFTTCILYSESDTGLVQ